MVGGGRFQGNWPHKATQGAKTPPGQKPKFGHRKNTYVDGSPLAPPPKPRTRHGVSPRPLNDPSFKPALHGVRLAVREPWGASLQKATSTPRPAPPAVEQLPVPDPAATIVVSAVLSIHNRGKLLRRAMDGYMWQTMPPDWWEIVLVDDMSTEDIAWTYAHLVGKINLRHVRIDHTRHPTFKKRNPGWEPGMRKSWYHTPAISTNVGCDLARGPVICLCHPEVMHAPTNFEIAAKRLSQERAYLFGTTSLGTSNTNKLLDERPEWTDKGWQDFYERTGLPRLNVFSTECYWYTSFLPRRAVEAVRGVDFDYLGGVAAEDDDFRERVRRAGWPPVHDGTIQSLHQDHSDETEKHRRRDTSEWFLGLEANRRLFAQRKAKNFPYMANKDTDWASRECVVSETRLRIGSADPEVIPGPAMA